ncbi:hypothetical protein [Krasilnikovia sp. MM14-A1259]|uniref:hypothetical protein n=1 Tax=Krasilnikovia sp. MM14-A1259 TaxID=3373539 RepID=UPI00399C6BE3
MEPIPEAVDWSRRADQWAQQANLPAQNDQWQSVSRWSEVVPTTRSGYPADGVGWRTETAEWQATTETARWRQTTEWRSTSGTHGWRSTTEAWQTGSAGAEGTPPQLAPPGTGQRAISSTAWQSAAADGQPGAQDIRQQPVSDNGAAPGGTGANPPWQQSEDSRPAWQQFAAPAPPWQAGGTAPWQQAPAAPGRDQSAAGTPPWDQSAAGTPPWEQGSPSAAPWEQGAATTPPWQQATSRPAPATPAWQQLVDPVAGWQQREEATRGDDIRRDETRSAGWQRPDPAGGRAPDSPSSWQRPDATPSWQAPGGAPGPQTTPSWQQTEAEPATGSWSAPYDSGRHLVRDDDRAQWRRDSAAGAGRLDDRPDQTGRRRVPEGGTGWSTRSESDNWAGHADTGTMPAFTDPAQSTSRGWSPDPQQAAGGWGTDPQQSTSRGWSADPQESTGRGRGTTDPEWAPDPAQSSSRLRRAEPERPSPPRRRAEPEPDSASWRADLATPDRRYEDDDWRRDPDTGQWSLFEDDTDEGAPRESERPRARRDPGPASDPWEQSAAETSVIPLPWQPRESREPRTDGWRPSPDEAERPARRRGYDSPGSTGGYDTSAPTGRRGYDAAPPTAERGYGTSAAAQSGGYDPEPDDRAGWRDEPRRGTRAGEWRDESRRATPAGEWRDDPRRDARAGERRDPSRREDGGQGNRRDESRRGGRRRAGDDDDDHWRAGGSSGIDQPGDPEQAQDPERGLDPDVWRRDPEPRPERDNWRMTRLEDAPTQSWRQELQAELRAEQRPPTGDAATEIRPLGSGGTGIEGRAQPPTGSASYREGNTGDWRRELASQGGLADGESRRNGDATSLRNPPGAGAGKASVPAARPVSARPSGGGAPGSAERAGAREEMLVGARSGGRWQDPPDTQWPPRPASGYQSAATGSYGRRAVGGLATASGRQPTNLLEPDEDEIEEDTGGPLAAVGYTVVWYGVPVVLFVLAMLVLNGAQQAHALGTLAKAAPQFGLSLVLSVVVAVGLRRASGSWKAASVGLASAVVGGGLATVLTSAITGNSLS